MTIAPHMLTGHVIFALGNQVYGIATIAEMLSLERVTLSSSHTNRFYNRMLVIRRISRSDRRSHLRPL